METAITIISAVLMVFFLFASSIKILGWQKKIFALQLQFFESYGLNRELMFAVGVIELLGASLIMLQHNLLGVVGAAAIAATSLGAIGFHLKFDSWKDAIPAMLTLTLSIFLLATNATLHMALNAL